MSRAAQHDGVGGGAVQDDGYSQFVALVRQMHGDPASVTHPSMRLDLVVSAPPQHVQRVYDTLQAVERQSEVHPMRGSNAGDAPALDMVCLMQADEEQQFLARHHLRIQLFSRVAQSSCQPDMTHITVDGNLTRNYHALKGGADHPHAMPAPYAPNMPNGDRIVGNLAAYYSIAFTLNGMPIVLHPRYNGDEGDQVWLPVRDVTQARRFYCGVLGIPFGEIRPDFNGSLTAKCYLVQLVRHPRDHARAAVRPQPFASHPEVVEEAEVVGYDKEVFLVQAAEGATVGLGAGAAWQLRVTRYMFDTILEVMLTEHIAHEWITNAPSHRRIRTRDPDGSVVEVVEVIAFSTSASRQIREYRDRAVDRIREAHGPAAAAASFEAKEPENQGAAAAAAAAAVPAAVSTPAAAASAKQGLGAASISILAASSAAQDAGGGAASVASPSQPKSAAADVQVTACLSCDASVKGEVVSFVCRHIFCSDCFNRCARQVCPICEVGGTHFKWHL